jgi:hypothetical protein
METMLRGFVMVVLVLAWLTACGGSPEPAADGVEQTADTAWNPVVRESMSDAQLVQHERVLSATNALASELMGELSAAMDAGGPIEAVVVCREKAPEIADRVAQEHGVMIGRTSHRLRNQANRPPEWARDAVARQVGEPTFLEGPVGQLGALLPIRLKAECQMCHGPTDGIDEEVLAVVAENYPDDEAVGFAVDDLRGWFWVEVPPPQIAGGL